MTPSYFCLRYVLLSCFISLGILGIIICTISSFFIYQLHENNYLTSSNDTLLLDYVKGSSSSAIILIIIGILIFAFSIYFWYIIDYKYNCRQIMTFSSTIISIFIIKVTTGIWVLIIHEKLGTLLLTGLKKTLAVPKFSIKETFLQSPLFNNNPDKIKLICCGYNETSTSELEELTSWFCCNFKRLNNESRIICENIYGKECWHLAIHSIRSILFHIFLLILCSIIIQILIMTSIIYCIKIIKKKHESKRIEFTLQKPSAPLTDTYITN